LYDGNVYGSLEEKSLEEKKERRVKTREKIHQK